MASLLCISPIAVSGAINVHPADSVSQLEEIVVTGSPNAISSKLLPYSVSVVSQQQLENAGETQVLSILSGMIPSLFVTERSIFGFGVSSSGGSGHIKLRGVGGDRASGVLMMVDGQPQFAGLYSHHVADFYSKDYVEKVEVLRGPGSVIYGSNAMAGAINVVTKNVSEDGIRTQLSSQYGSYNTWLSSVSNTMKYGRYSHLVSLSYNRTDGNIRNFDFNQAQGYAKLNYAVSDNWKATLDYTLMNLHANDPIYPKLTDPASVYIYTQSITRGEASLTASNNYSFGSGAARAYFSYGNHFVDDPRHFHSKDNRFGIIIYQGFTPWKGAGITLGFDFDRYSGEIPVSSGKYHSAGSLSTLERKSITEYSPYFTAFQSLKNDLVILDLGLRLANSDIFHTQLVPQFGCSLNPGREFTIKFNLAMGYRNPSFRELYLYRMANPELQPERMMNYEISVGKSFSRFFSGSITAYFCRGNNLIQVLDMKNQNTGKFINKGIEISAKSQPMHDLFLSASYSYLHTSITNLTGAPGNQFFLGADWSPIKKFSIGINFRLIGNLFVAEDMAEQNYALLNMKLSYELSHHFSLFARLDNITDTQYTINKGYKMPGFTIMGGFKLKI